MIRAYRSDLGDYMRRWILRLPWFNLRLHNILKSDEGRDLHDHPFSFWSFILRGGYIEHRPGCYLNDYDGTCDCEIFTAPALVRRKATDFHRLELLGGAPAWTFVIASNYFRPWGFLVRGAWVPFEEYGRSYYTTAKNEGNP